MESTERPKLKLWPVALGVAVAAIAAFGIGVGVGGTGDTTTPVAASDPAPAVTKTVEVPGPTVTATVDVPGPKVTVTVTAKAPKPKPQPKQEDSGSSTIPGDGTYIVGKDIKPGTYQSEPAPGGIDLCSWQRLSGTSGSLDDFIAGDVSQGQTTVTIDASDKAFETTGCKTWKQIS